MSGSAFKPSNNDYDWLGPGIYFWEANPKRGLEFAKEASGNRISSISNPFVIGAVIELGLCLDLTTPTGLEWIRGAYDSLVEVIEAAASKFPSNSKDQLRRNLDCAVIRRLHTILGTQRLPPVDNNQGRIHGGPPLYPGAGFREKTHPDSGPQSSMHQGRLPRAFGSTLTSKFPFKPSIRECAKEGINASPFRQHFAARLMSPGPSIPPEHCPRWPQLPRPLPELRRRRRPSPSPAQSEPEAASAGPP